MKYLILLLISTSALANWQVRTDDIDGVSISQSVAPSKDCKSLGTVYVTIHQPGSNLDNLAKAAKSKGGDFVFVRYTSSYYSYEYGGDLYKCKLN